MKTKERGTPLRVMATKHRTRSNSPSHKNKKNKHTFPKHNRSLAHTPQTWPVLWLQAAPISRAKRPQYRGEQLLPELTIGELSEGRGERNGFEARVEFFVTTSSRKHASPANNLKQWINKEMMFMEHCCLLLFFNPFLCVASFPSSSYCLVKKAYRAL